VTAGARYASPGERTVTDFRDINAFNAAWLRAWSDKDVATLLDFYAEDTVYMDSQVPAGARGHAELRPYLERLFAATPPMRYEADEVWPIEGGYAGRWICTIDLPDGKQSFLRGFDLVLLREGKISLNEVYTHSLPAKP
jgi:ketosteroid isomerase-like protein